MAAPRNTIARRVREVGGYYDRAARCWVLPAVAGLPELRTADLATACHEAQRRREAAQRASPVGPVYGFRCTY